MFGKTLGDFVEAAGGAPTLVSGSEQYLAYQRGTVDIGMTGVSGVKSRKLWEVMDTITVANNADIEFMVVVNNKWWDGLTEEQRKIISEAAAHAEKSVRDAMSKIETDAYDAAKKNGMKVVDLTPEDLAAWKDVSKPVFDFISRRRATPARRSSTRRRRSERTPAAVVGSTAAMETVPRPPAGRSTAP